MKRRMISLLLVLCILLSMSPVMALGASAEEPEEEYIVEEPAELEPEEEIDAIADDPVVEPLDGDGSTVVASGYCGGEGDGTNLTWTLTDDGTLTISGTGAMTDYSSSNSVPWSSYKSSMTTLVLEDGIKTIGSYAFYNCSGFTGDLVIPDSVTSIGKDAFISCSGFTGNLVIGDSVTSIGDYAFCSCSGFTGNLEIPDSVTKIGSHAFSYCRGFTGNLEIPNNVTSIGYYAFAGCSGFTGDLLIPDSVTSIEYGFINSCGGISRIEVSSSNTVYASKDGVLYDIDFTKAIRAPEGISGNLEIPDSVIGIGNYAFYGCSGFTGNLKIPNGVTEISYYAFSGCRGFTGDLIIPGNVTRISSDAFYGCSGFTGDLIIPDGVTTISTNAFSYCRGFTGDLVIPDSVTKIWFKAFYCCSGFDGNLVISDSVTEIDSYAFSYCSGFTGDLEIPDSVTSIGNYAFSDCRGFSGGLEIPDSVISIGNYAFDDCSGFTGGLVIGNSVASIGDRAFRGCSGFTGDLEIPDSVISIGNYAFYDCSGFTGDLVIGNSVASIGDRAFSCLYCSGFTGSLKIPDSVTEIGSSAFENCSGFTGNLEIPDNIIAIAGSTFENCSGFTGNLVIPDSVTSIGSHAFDGCSGFTGNLVIPDSVTKIGSWAFYNCSGFTGNLKISNSVTWINDGTFYGCSGFTGNLVIPDSVTFIGEGWTFYGCSGFTGDLVIPGGMNYIGGESFFGCSGLSGNVYFKGEAPGVIDALDDYSSFPSDFTLYYIPGTSGWTDSEYYDASTGTWNGYKLATWEGNTALDSRILSVYPAKGTHLINKSFEFKIKYDTAIAQSVRSGYAALDFTKEPFSLYSADGTLIYQLEESTNLDGVGGFSYSAISYTSSNNTMRISISGLEDDTDYYITMGEGFVVFEDGSVSPAIEKGQLSFTTKKYSGMYGSEFAYEDQLLKGMNSTVYNHTLAIASLNLAISAYNNEAAENNDYIADIAGKDVKNMLMKLGFDEDKIDISHYGGEPAGDTIGAAIASKELTEGATLLTVAIRGGEYKAEWAGNLLLGESGAHEGFALAAGKVLGYIKDYIAQNDVSGYVVLWLTGYSRAAAAANILGAAINNGALADTGISLEKKNTYVYTFETPRGIVKSDVDSGDIFSSGDEHTNIFNIINPADYVTMVAPSGWGFTRYGVDLYLPNELTTVRYLDLVDEFESTYEAYMGEEVPKPFQNYKIVLDVYFADDGANLIKKDETTKSSQAYYFNKLINKTVCGGLLKSRAYYYEELENTVYVLLEDGFRKEIDMASLVIQIMLESGKEIDRHLGEQLAKKVAKKYIPYGDVIVKAIMKQLKTPELINSIKRVILSTGADITEKEAYDVAKFIVKKLDLEDLIKENYNDILTFVENWGWVSKIHFSQTCLAWMNTVDHVEWFSENNNAYGCKYRMLTCNCPVNVKVYDSDGELVAAIIDDAVQEIENSSIVALIDENEQKIVLLPADGDFSVEVEATDEGTMTYSVAEYNMDSAQTERLVNYYEVELQDGAVFTGEVPEMTEDKEVEYPLYSEDGTQIDVSEELSGDQIENYTVSVEVEGDGVAVGTGTFVKGEYAVAVAMAEEGAEFLGWYDESDELVTTDLEYRFCVKADVTLVAKFTVASILGDVNGDGNITATDARWLLQYLSGARELTEEQLLWADVNGDGEVTAVDARWILQYLSGARDENYQAK